MRLRGLSRALLSSGNAPANVPAALVKRYCSMHPQRILPKVVLFGLFTSLHLVIATTSDDADRPALLVCGASRRVLARNARDIVCESSACRCLISIIERNAEAMRCGSETHHGREWRARAGRARNAPSECAERASVEWRVTARARHAAAPDQNGVPRVTGRRQTQLILKAVVGSCRATPAVDARASRNGIRRHGQVCRSPAHSWVCHAREAVSGSTLESDVALGASVVCLHARGGHAGRARAADSLLARLQKCRVGVSQSLSPVGLEICSKLAFSNCTSS